jgi:hypothetical protein
VLEHLLTHGPESVAEEFQSGKDVINQLKGFQYIDQQGYVCLLFFSFQFWLKLGHCFSSSQHALLDVKLVCENLDIYYWDGSEIFCCVCKPGIYYWDGSEIFLSKFILFLVCEFSTWI